MTFPRKMRYHYSVIVRIFQGSSEEEEAMAQKKASYGNESISALKGADRVRKRPGVIFGSDGLEGCEHAVFEIMRL